MIEQLMLAQPFAVVCDDDHEHLIEQPSASKFVEQLADPLVQVSKTVVVRIVGQGEARRGDPRFVELKPALEEEPEIGLRTWHRTEAVRGTRRQDVGRVGVRIIEEGEERTAGSLPRQ